MSKSNLPIIKCPNCNSDDIRVVEMCTHIPEGLQRLKIQKVVGKWRFMCDYCGYAGAIFEDSKLHDEGKNHKKLRDQLPIELVNAIRITVKKEPLPIK